MIEKIPVSLIPKELLDVLWTPARAEKLCAEEVPFRTSGGETLAKTSSYKKQGLFSTFKN